MGEDQVRPPVEVARPKPSPVVPGGRAASGTTLWQLKIDGWRLVAFHLDGRVVLQTRQGRDVTDHFPEIAEAARRLPFGTVVDGEAAAWKDGAFDFLQLPAGPAARRKGGVAIIYVAFDVLAVAGRDVRGLPLAERWELLKPLVAAAGPPFELVMATEDRDEAIGWMEALAAQGVEGLVVKPLSGKYRPGTSGDWLKYRRRDTLDAVVTGLIGTPERPRALGLALPDGRTVVSTNLTALQARAVAAAATENGGTAGLVVEIRLGHGRHGTATFVRVRGDW